MMTSVRREAGADWFVWVALAFAAITPGAAYASMLTFVRDTISTSAPEFVANHAIEFTITHAIPASGSIVITPQAGSFVIPAGLATSDIDLAVATSSSYVDRVLADSADATSDGVSIVSGQNGSITFTLASTSGLVAGSRVKITIGTNATFGGTGSLGWGNPDTVGSYRIDIVTRDTDAAVIDKANTLIAIVPQVAVSSLPTAVMPVITDGYPSGQISAGNPLVEISVKTNQLATCRYGTVASTTYASLPYSFSTYDGESFFADLSGLVDNTAYTYYVRCRSFQGAENDTDYVISFNLAPTPETTNSVEGSGIIGRGGSGDYPNGSSVLFLSTVTLNGWTFPSSNVRILQDGIAKTTVKAKQNGSFSAQITQLERGVYTFAVSATDNAGHSSGSVSTTLTLEAGTNNTINNVIVPPITWLDADSVPIGSGVTIRGESIPQSSISVRIVPQGKTPGALSTFTASTSADGTWELDVPRGKLGRGTYSVSARVALSNKEMSNYSAPVLLGIGESVTQQPTSVGSIGRSDLNQDGKVNLIDFSILLTSWGSAGAGDINGDGTTNLADFSMMLFDWTG